MPGRPPWQHRLAALAALLALTLGAQVPLAASAAAPTVTTVTLVASSASPLAANTVKTLTATVSPAAVAGSVQFRDGPGNIGGPVSVSGGIAATTTTLVPRTHWLTAVFTPADAASVSGSASAVVPVVVSVPAG